MTAAGSTDRLARVDTQKSASPANGSATCKRFTLKESAGAYPELKPERRGTCYSVNHS